MNQIQASPKILIVDDKPQNLFALEKLLNQLEVQVIRTTSGAEALGLTLEHDFCLAIVDVQMPEMDGYELVELLRGNPSTASLPVIFVSAIYSDEYHHRKGYDAGAVDFLSKPFVPEILLSKVRVFLDLYRQRLELQELIGQREDEIKRRQQAETALRAANATLSKLNADKDRFFTTVSQELRTPFNTLLDDSYLMLTEIGQLTCKELQEMTERVYGSAGTIHGLMETLMTWSSNQRIHLNYEPAEVELKRLIDQALEWGWKTATRKNIELDSTVEEEIYVCADEMMLATIIRNLIANSLKYTLSGGQVIVSAQPIPSAANGHAKGPVEWVEVSVMDTGVGMSQEDIAKLFRLDLLYTTPGTAKEKGSGLGLIMCKEMVEHHGGRIRINSPGRGATARFTVPAAEL